MSIRLKTFIVPNLDKIDYLDVVLFNVRTAIPNPTFTKSNKHYYHWLSFKHMERRSVEVSDWCLVYRLQFQNSWCMDRPDSGQRPGQTSATIKHYISIFEKLFCSNEKYFGE